MQKFHFLKKNIGDNKFLDRKLFAQMAYTNSHQGTSRQDVYFMFCL